MLGIYLGVLLNFVFFFLFDGFCFIKVIYFLFVGFSISFNKIDL